MKYFLGYSFQLLTCNYYSSTAFSFFRRRSPLQTRSTSKITLDVDAFCAEAYIEATSGIDNENVRSASARTRRLDIKISAREWMEEIQNLEGSIHGVGAYTVVRCDAAFHSGPDGNLGDIQWNIWGKDFHICRLISSYDMLMGNQSASQSNIDSSSFEQEKAVDEVMHALLKDASQSLGQGYNNIVNSTNDTSQLYRTMMLTVLWTPSQYQQTKHTNVTIPSPTIRGHATFAGPPRTSILDLIPPPISACLALPDELTPNALAALPRRYKGNTQSVDATAKISAWCHARKSLEDPTRYKVPGMNVGEVLLLNQCKGASSNFIESLEILEGLTSNLFVIYKDGTVRTAPTPKVLPGYSRHLAIKALMNMSSDRANCTPKLVLHERAPTVQDAMAGLWSEVFITSAIRILIPVHRVLMPGVVVSDESSNSHMILVWQGDGSVTSSKVEDLRREEFQIGLDESYKYSIRRRML